MSVKRYDCWGTTGDVMEQTERGEFVKYDDYVKLEAERDALREAFHKLANEFDEMHSEVASRYVAERISAVLFNE